MRRRECAIRLVPEALVLVLLPDDPRQTPGPWPHGDGAGGGGGGDVVGGGGGGAPW